MGVASPPPPPPYVVPTGKFSPWVSGYNRSERMSVGRPDMKEAWADGGDPYQRSGIPHEPPPVPRPSRVPWRRSVPAPHPRSRRTRVSVAS